MDITIRCLDEDVFTNSAFAAKFGVLKTIIEEFDNNTIILPDIPGVNSIMLKELLLFEKTGEMAFDEVNVADNVAEAIRKRVTTAEYLEGSPELMQFLKMGIAYHRAHLKAMIPEVFNVTVYETHVRRSIATDDPLSTKFKYLQKNIDASFCTEACKGWCKPIELPQNAPWLIPKAEKKIISDGDFSKVHKKIYKNIRRILSISEHIVIAGGCALAMMQNDEYVNDIDVFIWGLEPSESTKMAQRIINVCNVKNPIVISDNAVTFTLGKQEIVVQIILRCYRTPDEVLYGFDLPASRVLLILDDQNIVIYTTPSFRMAARLHANWIDPDRQSLTYAQRLMKYTTKGFSILVPGLDRRRIYSEIYATQFIFAKTGLDLLLCLERIIRLRIEYRIATKLVGRQNNKSIVNFGKLRKELKEKIKHNPITFEVLLKEHVHARTIYSVISETGLPFSDYAEKMKLVNRLQKILIDVYHFVERSRVADVLFGSGRILSNEKMLDNLNWRTIDPGSQTVHGSFQPVDVPFYHAAYGLNEMDAV